MLALQGAYAVSEENEPIATTSQVKRIIRRRLGKHVPHEELGLNLYPMMDMMTILLVFLIQSFAQSSAANVVQSEELQIPQSTSDRGRSRLLFRSPSRPARSWSKASKRCPCATVRSTRAKSRAAPTASW